ncbi:MAG TPA: hypothetical protein VKH35_14705 [Thermoanaerobaculia bacterium]|nr:hypothetical protein [Thermoanaerobaculia bacterium]
MLTGSLQTFTSAPIVPPAETTHAWLTGQNFANAAGAHAVNFDDFVLDDGVAAIPAFGPLELQKRRCWCSRRSAWRSSGAAG